MSKKKKIMIVTVCICLALVVMGGTVAWYSRQDDKRARTEEAIVMAPYNLYLLNPNATDSLQFAVGNLHPGEKKQTVICVSNKRPKRDSNDPNEDDEESVMSELAKDSEFGYDLMLVYTENLAVEYTVYPLERFDISSKDKLEEGDIIMDDDTKDKYYWNKIVKNDKEITIPLDDITDEMRERVGTAYNVAAGDEPIVNAGAYRLSNDALLDEPMQLKFTAGSDGEEGEYEYDYYLIEIDWKAIDNFDDYKKETDMVYVVVNAKQPRPILKEEAILIHEDSGILTDDKSGNLTDDED